MIFFFFSLLLVSCVRSSVYVGRFGTQYGDTRKSDGDDNYWTIIGNITAVMGRRIMFLGELNGEEVTISINGWLSFGTVSSYPVAPQSLPTVGPVIAGFWCDLDLRGETTLGNDIYYRISTSTDDINHFVSQIPDPNRYPNFSPDLVVVGTWDRVGHFSLKVDTRVTFQIILLSSVVSTEEKTIAIFNYELLEVQRNALMGFGTTTVGYENPYSGTTGINSELENNSNCGVSGRWIYQIDSNGANCFGVPWHHYSVCSTRGDCIGPDQCQCREPFAGNDCEYISLNFTCRGISWMNESICSGHGVCIDQDVCECYDGYYGLECDLFPLYCSGVMFNDTSNVCSGRGKCSSVNNEVYCDCISNEFYGLVCEGYYCFGIVYDSVTDNPVCSGNGNCTSPDSCTCFEDYMGNWCQYPVCFGIVSYVVLVCSSHGTCTARDTCECYEGYSADDCHMINTCDNFNYTEPNVCSSHGSCVGNDICKCELGYIGENCEGNICYGHYLEEDVCSGNGDCVSPNVCVCYDGHDGKDCENIRTCDSIDFDYPSVCSRHGDCIGQDVCECYTGYSGDFCEFFRCFGINMGNETSSEICKGHGNCVSTDKCSCEVNYYGIECEVTKCNSVLSNDSEHVCSGFQFSGRCWPYENCECEENYFGDFNCEKTTCRSILSDSPLVCSGRGSCWKYNKCVCDEHYSGYLCNLTTCFGEDLDNMNVCGGHGECIEYNDCNCTDPSSFYGPNCDFSYCFEVGSDDINEVCGGHGRCVSTDTCECEKGYTSSFSNDPKGVHPKVCDEWTCFGVSKDNIIEVCSGRGQCTELDVCECKSPFIYNDENCEKVSQVFTSVVSLGVFSLLSFSALLCIAFFVLVGICFLLISSVAGILISIGGCCTVFFLKQRTKITKYRKLKGFDVLLQEQLMEGDQSVAHLKINKEMFKIDYDDVKIIQSIGEGGSQAIVFKAIYHSQIVAFKCFKTRFLVRSQNNDSSTGHYFREFEKEISILSSVMHPSIVRFFGCSLKPPRVGIVMEFCEKGEILDFYKRYRKRKESEGNEGNRFLNFYPFNEKVRHVLECVSAMIYLHKRSIIHRDLKPENCLIDSEEKVKLMDFGLSRFIEKVDERNSSESKKQMTRKIGTSFYIAPEIVASEFYDEKVDVFSFGIMMFVLFTENSRPYGENDSNIQFRVASNPTLRPNINEIILNNPCFDEEQGKNLSELIQICWKHDPTDRYSFVLLEKKMKANFVN